MDWQQIVINSYGNVARILARTLDGLTVDDLNKQPKPDCNSIGWLTWNLTRWQDRTIAELIGEEQLWARDEWCKKFNRPPDTTDTGWGTQSARCKGISITGYSDFTGLPSRHIKANAELYQQPFGRRFKSRPQKREGSDRRRPFSRYLR